MSEVAIKDLLEAGVHFGHPTRRWNPKMAPYIFQERNGIHIIDLQKTAQSIDEAYEFLREVAQMGGTFLFVGTKKQTQEAIKEAATKAEVFYVSNRWLGGMLTNFKTIRKSILKLNEYNKMEEEGMFDLLPKKEVLTIKKEVEKLENNLGGIKEMKKIPSVLIVIDPQKEAIAVSEAKKLGIPVVGLLDTNANPELIDYVVAGNNDALRAVSLIVNTFADAIIEGKHANDSENAEESEKEEKEESQEAEEETEEKIEE